MNVRSAVLGVVMLAVVGCRTEPPAQQVEQTQQACTMIGCSDGLTVLVENAPPPPYTIEVTPPDGQTRSMRCEAATPCDGGLFFEGIAAEELTVRVAKGAESSTQSVRAEYTLSQPNGPTCPPTCRQARVQVSYSP